MPSLLLPSPDIINLPSVLLLSPDIINMPSVLLPSPDIINMPSFLLASPDIINMPSVLLPSPDIINLPSVLLPSPDIINLPSVLLPSPDIIGNRYIGCHRHPLTRVDIQCHSHTVFASFVCPLLCVAVSVGLHVSILVWCPASFSLWWPCLLSLFSWPCRMVFEIVFCRVMWPNKESFCCLTVDNTGYCFPARESTNNFI